MTAPRKTRPKNGAKSRARSAHETTRAGHSKGRAAKRATQPLTEFQMIAALRERWGSLAPDIGDDAAVLRVPRGEQIVVSTDAAIDTIHFRRAWLTPREIGYRAVTAALSDLAAMAAVPLGVLTALELQSDAADYLMDLADGIADAARAANTTIVGGNTARASAFAITTTVIGSVYTPLRRSGARAGDLLYVTGALGAPAASVRLLKARKNPPQALRDRFARPSARIQEARWLAARGATAAIDISDGLAQDAGHLADESNVGVEIQTEHVPVFPGASDDDALGGGEEYELLVAAPHGAPLPDAEFIQRFGIPLTAIGRVIAGGGVHISKHGKRVATLTGYDHFSR